MKCVDRVSAFYIGLFLVCEVVILLAGGTVLLPFVSGFIKGVF